MDVFERYELKYMLNREQKKAVLDAMDGRMSLDNYGRTTIRNIYYDTEDKRLIRTSLEKPVYKEKLRVRSYSQVSSDDQVFVELKKKYMDVVYKRRISLTEQKASDWLNGSITKPLDTQIADEIEYFINFYSELKPSCFLSYEREAYFDLEGSDLRITFDENILARNDNMSLQKSPYGTDLLDPGRTLMEIKVPGALPLWLTKTLSKNQIKKISYSKYGEFYIETMLNNNEGGLIYA